MASQDPPSGPLVSFREPRLFPFLSRHLHWFPFCLLVHFPTIFPFSAFNYVSPLYLISPFLIFLPFAFMHCLSLVHSGNRFVAPTMHQFNTQSSIQTITHRLINPQPSQGHHRTHKRKQKHAHIYIHTSARSIRTHMHTQKDKRKQKGNVHTHTHILISTHKTYTDKHINLENSSSRRKKKI